MADYSKLCDSELQHLLIMGDTYAFTEIYNRYKGVLHQHALNMLKDRDEAKDVLQELFTNLWVNRESIHVQSNLSGYLYTGVRNRVLTMIAHRQVESKYISSLGDFINKGEFITDHRVRERQLAELIEKEIDALPGKMREVFRLSRISNLSHKEIAEELSISEQTVRTQVRNALRLLRVKLGLLTLFSVLLNIRHPF
ncbi:MAG: RNA polymerase sigma factor [Daejeonella sp.]|uniref:RNA polymerase sigma factor n=1 Tax=Daejeonella sp. JGW-45 TaxID=3034148 RepID=UPI0023EB13F6|nr:RNA polymerase sigma-70 factor [Daejeonella sp. JGW-45]